MRFSKTDLVNGVVNALPGLTKKDTRVIIDNVFTAIQCYASDDGVLAIRDFGVFKTRTRAARKGRNPQDGSVIQIAESISMVFKATKHAK